MRLTTIAVLVATTGPAFAQAGGDPPAEPTPPPSHDDLAKAADATAEVAAVPPGDQPAAPPSKPSSDDIDLSALGLDPSGAAAFDDKLNLYGFADFGFHGERWGKDMPFIPNNTKSFALGNLNIYLAKNLTAKARALAEVRFTFLPNGSQNLSDGTSFDATANDPNNFGRPVQWGGIVIERAYAEYDVNEYLTIRGGHWLTPYGIWNIDHGSPVIIATFRPFIIGEQFFPEHQTGLDLFGHHATAGYKIGYHLTASNGRGGSEAQLDIDSKIAFGGRLEVDTPFGARFGGSYYRGRYTSLTTTPGAMPQTFLEAAYGADAQYDHGPLHLQGELIVRERHFADGQRSATMAGFTADGRDLGFYLLAGYRFDQLWNVMPFFFHEDYRPTDHTVTSKVRAENFGLNFRPSPSWVLKVGGAYVSFVGDQGLFAHNSLWIYNSQASWVF
jgi:hypothetical protein